MRKAKPASARVKTSPPTAKPVSGRERMRAYRARLKAAGLRPVQHWVPDVRDPKVRERIRRQAQRLDGHPEAKALDAWLDAVLADSDWN